MRTASSCVVVVYSKEEKELNRPQIKFHSLNVNSFRRGNTDGSHDCGSDGDGGDWMQMFYLLTS